MGDEIRKLLFRAGDSWPWYKHAIYRFFETLGVADWTSWFFRWWWVVPVAVIVPVAIAAASRKKR